MKPGGTTEAWTKVHSWQLVAPGMVSEVSATLVATTTRRAPGGTAPNTAVCASRGSIAYSGSTCTGPVPPVLASLVPPPASAWPPWTHSEQQLSMHACLQP